MEGKTTHISLCRPANREWLATEIRACGAHPFPPSAGTEADGWLAWQAPGGALPAPLIFERQRLPAAQRVQGASQAALADALLSTWLAALETAPPPHTLHVFAPEAAQGTAQTARAERLAAALERAWAAASPQSHSHCLPPGRFRAAGGRGTVWQVCLLPGTAWEAWSAVSPAAALADACPGGVHRMPPDDAAPSRSYLKLEEALDVLGIAPRPRERAIDLGAAPGGWSYALLKRGCRVLAVDNGPLKLRGLDALPGELTHLRADGLRLHPPPGWLPADWLLSDMLIAPGVCLGLLRKWIEGGWMRRCVVNVKLPQREPLAALRPLQEYLAGVPGLSWRLRQLYHDRREVTLLATLAGTGRPRPTHGAQPGRPAKPTQRARPGRPPTPHSARSRRRRR